MSKKRIIVPTGGNLKHNLARAKKAFSLGGKESSYILTGIGSDPEKPWIKEPHDLTMEDYFLLAGVSKENLSVDYKSKNSRENLLNTLSNKKGQFYITSYPVHLERFELLLDEYQRKGTLSKDIELNRIETSQSLKDFLYGNLAEIKDVYHLDRLNKKVGSLLKKIFG